MIRQMTLYSSAREKPKYDLSDPQQLLKWIGNKHRFGKQIVEMIPKKYGKYIEPFTGSGAILGFLAPHKAIAGDNLPFLIDLWNLVKYDPETLLHHYSKLWEKYMANPKEAYLSIRDSFNENRNPLDFLFLSRSCYGGIIRFRKDGKMSTPIGPHKPISPEALKKRILDWHYRVKDTQFINADFRETMKLAKRGDIVYCDPPYVYSQSIIYGAQDFELQELWKAVERCKKVGAKVMVSIVGSKKSGNKKYNLDIPGGLFEREILIDVGSSMIRRFQKKGKTMEGEFVKDRLLLTW